MFTLSVPTACPSEFGERRQLQPLRETPAWQSGDVSRGTQTGPGNSGEHACRGQCTVARAPSWETSHHSDETGFADVVHRGLGMNGGWAQKKSEQRVHNGRNMLIKNAPVLPQLLPWNHTLKWKLVTQSCPILCKRMDCSLPGSSVHGILQARTLEWAAVAFSGESSWPRDWTQVSCIASGFFNDQVTRETLHTPNPPSNVNQLLLSKF